MTDNIILKSKYGQYTEQNLIDLIHEHINIQPYRFVYRKKQYRSHTVSEKVKQANDLPTLSKLCIKLGTSTQKIKKLEKKGNFPRLSEALTRLRDVIRNMLIVNGLEGLYDTKFAEFVAINECGMRKTQHVEQSVKSLGGVTLYLPQLRNTGNGVVTVKEPLKDVTSQSHYNNVDNIDNNNNKLKNVEEKV